MEMKKASVSWPERVRPAASMMVPERNKGSLLRPDSSKNLMYATIPALAFRVSNIVSIKMICAPPSTRPWIYS